ncbi:MAG: polysaccharide biosynthesis/export family protein [bacterium]
MKRKWFFLPVTFFLLALAFCACTAPQEEPAPPIVKRTAATEAYVIGPEDVLEISVWQNQDLSRTVTVRPDGKISLPLLSDLQAAGLTPQELKQEIASGIKPYVDAPEVSVIVQQINSSRFFIQGEVNTPGVYPLRSNVTLSQAVTLAGGFTEFAKKSKIQIFRKWRNSSEIIEANYNMILSGDPAEDIALRPGDTIVVP